MENDNDRKKEYLNQFKDNKEAAIRIEKQIEELERREMSPRTSVIDLYGRGAAIKDLSDYETKKEELVNEMHKSRYERISAYQEIFKAIEKLPNEQERQVLTLRYIRGFKWEKITMEMHLEWAQVHRIHARALKHFQIPNEKMIDSDTL